MSHSLGTMDQNMTLLTSAANTLLLYGQKDHKWLQAQIFILETAILATPYFQTFYYDGCTAGQKVKSGES